VNQLTQQHRAQQLLLRRATAAQVERLWPALDWAELDKTFPALAVTLATLVHRNRKVSAGLSVAYLRAFRASQGARGDVAPVIAPALVPDQFQASLHATSVAAAKSAAGRGVPAAVAMANALTQTKGSMARLVLDAGRSTITDTIREDPAAHGWRRVLGGGGCGFCAPRAGVRMTSERGVPGPRPLRLYRRTGLHLIFPAPHGAGPIPHGRQE
jgi:hypothetical protein